MEFGSAIWVRGASVGEFELGCIPRMGFWMYLYSVYEICNVYMGVCL